MTADRPLADRGIVLHVGGFTGQGVPTGWSFDCRGTIPGSQYQFGGPELYAGYTCAELHALAAPPAPLEGGVRGNGPAADGRGT